MCYYVGVYTQSGFTGLKYMHVYILVDIGK